MGAVAVLAALARSMAHATPDASWLLYAAGRVLEGAVLGEDLVDAVPPLVIWLKVPVVWLSRELGMSPWSGWVMGLCLLTAGSLWCAARVLRRQPDWSSPRQRGWFLVFAAAVVLLVPRHDFGQREHLALVLTLPYVILLGSRARTAVLPGGLAVGLGVLAGLGMSIKPHFAALLPASLIYLRFRTRLPLRRALGLPEHLAAALTGVLAIAVVLLFAPGWVRYALEYWPLYARYLPVNPLGVALVGPGAGISLLTVLMLLVLGPHMSSKRETAEALMTGALAFHLSAALQAKGFQYHFVPTLVFGTLALAVVWGSLRRPVPRLARPLYAASAGAAVCTLLALGTRDALLELAGHPIRRGDLDSSLDVVAPAIREHYGAPTIAVLSSNIASGFPLVTEIGAVWTSRHSGLWMLPALYDDQLFRYRMVQTRPPAERPPLERRFVDEVYEDLQRRVPEVILVPHPDASFSGWGGALQFNYLEYFGAEPRFRQLLGRYRDVGDIGIYRALARRAGTDTSFRVPTIANPPPVAPGPDPRIELRIAPGAVLLFGFFLVLGLLVEVRSRRTVQPGL